MTRQQLERLSDLLAMLSEEAHEEIDGQMRDRIGYVRDAVQTILERK